jgi:hypothetical protein
MIDCDPQQIGKLRRFLHDRAEYSRHVRGAVETQAERCSGWKHSMGGIEDHAAGGKRDPVLRRDFRRDVRFHVDGSRPGFIVKLPLFPRGLHHFVRPRDMRVNGAGQHFKQSLGPGPVGGENTFAGGHAGRHDPVAGNEAGRQASGNSEADNPGRAARDSRVERGTQSRALVANYRYAWTARDTRFKRQAGYGDDARLFRHPHPASRAPLSQRRPPRSTSRCTEKPSYKRGFCKCLGMIWASESSKQSFVLGMTHLHRKDTIGGSGGLGDVNER